MSIQTNLVNILFKRELTGCRSKVLLNDSLEDSFCNNNILSPTVPSLSPETVLSTIAIAVSPDGSTFASTHGDHTVKIFFYNSGVVFRVFKGHPRTPWTVKYHPIDSNVVASGCLGHEVRIWDIARGVCVNLIRLDNSVISLSFHPHGELIAISCGSVLTVWEWKEGISTANGGYLVGQGQYPHRRAVIHPRNIRAVMFHPNGEYIFAAAPDSPRILQSTFSPCRLYGIPLTDIIDASKAQSAIELASNFTILPEIHLYSDGGMDISTDGRYLLTCSNLFVPPAPTRLPTPLSGFAPLLASSFPTQANMGHGPLGGGQGGQIGQIGQGGHNFPGSTLHQNRFRALRNSQSLWEFENDSDAQPQPLPPTVQQTSHLPQPISRPPNGALISSRSLDVVRCSDCDDEPSVPGPQPPLPFISSLCSSLSLSIQSTDNSLHQQDSYHLISSSSSNAAPTPLSQSTSLQRPPPIPPSFSPPRPPSSSLNSTTPPIARAVPSHQRLPFPAGSTRRRAVSTLPVPQSAPEARPCTAFDSPEPAVQADIQHTLRRLPARIMSDKVDVLSPPRKPSAIVLEQQQSSWLPGWTPKDHLCVFKISFTSGTTATTIAATPEKYKPLTGALMRAVTSVKFSPSCRYAVIGYGVRHRGGVQDHPVSTVSCEIVRINQSPSVVSSTHAWPNSKETPAPDIAPTDLASSGIVADIEDEVNIVQFLSIPGAGMVYGTKKGRIKAFVR